MSVLSTDFRLQPDVLVCVAVCFVAFWLGWGKRHLTHLERINWRIMTQLDELAGSIAELKAAITVEIGQIGDLVGKLRNEIANLTQSQATTARLQGMIDDIHESIARVKAIIPDEPEPESVPEPNVSEPTPEDGGEAEGGSGAQGSDGPG